MKTIEEQWESFMPIVERRLGGKDEELMELFKCTFYASYSCALSGVSGLLVVSPLTLVEGLQEMNQELTEFNEMIVS